LLGLVAHRWLRQRLLHPARGRRRLLLGMVGQRHRIQHVLPVFGGAKEQVEGLREDQHMFMPLDEDRFQRGVDIGAIADLDRLQRVECVDHRAGADRDAGRAQRAGEADDIVGHVAGGGIEVIDGGHKRPYSLTRSVHSLSRLRGRAGVGAASTNTLSDLHSLLPPVAQFIA
jgi:hypothetical protein